MRSRNVRSAFALAALTGCSAAPDEPGGRAGGVAVVELAQSQVLVGQTFVLFASGLADDPARPLTEVRVHFQGRYTADDGSVSEVDTTAPLLLDGTDAQGRQVLRWNRFGPFRNPFHERDRPGRFQGSATLMYARTGDDLPARGKAMEVTVDVLPSLIVDELQPVGADCGAPALRALAGVAYRMTVRPVGLKATRFSYELNRVNASAGVTNFRHEYAQPVGQDTLGEDEAVIFEPVGPDEQFYVSAIRVVAWDQAGQTVETVVPLSVHRPMEVAYEGRYELAEVYEPVAVSGCTPGGINTVVEYSESHEEVRQQSVSVTVSRSFGQDRGVSRTEGWQRGISEGESTSSSLGGAESEEETSAEGYGLEYHQSASNEVGFSSSDGESWGWNLSEGVSNTDYESQMNSLYGEGSWSGTVGVEGSGSIPGFAKVTGKASTTVGVSAGAGTATTTGGSRTASAQRGFSSQGSTDNTRSFGSTTTDSQSQTLSGQYALGRGRTSSFEDTTSRNEARTWSLGEGTAESEVVSEGMTEAENETWVRSSSVETSQALSGTIPRGRFGMFYRQTSRWVRRAEVRAYDRCGLATHLGELQFNEWTWAPELAIGDSCDATPSALPKAQCLIAPCGG